jgi:VIT1/CCC1 family predicted Fe2+/Mn2+ transporter
LVAWLSGASYVIPLTVAASLISLFVLGAIAARAGGAHLLTAALRVTLWSALAMAVTAGVGALVGMAGDRL